MRSSKTLYIQTLLNNLEEAGSWKLEDRRVTLALALALALAHFFCEKSKCGALVLFWPTPEGPPKTKSTDPPVHLLNLRPTHPPSDFFFSWLFFLVRFWAFLSKGSSKTRFKKNAKSPCRKLFPRKFSENRQIFWCQFFLNFFVLLSFQVYLARGVQKH